MSEDTVNPTHLLMIDYVARLEKKVKELGIKNKELETEVKKLEEGNLNLLTRLFYSLNNNLVGH